MLKQTIAIAITCSFLSPTTFAESNAAIFAGAGNGSRMYMAGEGDYRQIEVDVTKLAEAALNAAQVTQKEDREYILAAVLELHNAYVEFNNEVFTGPVLDLQVLGLQGKTTDIKTFMNVTSALKAKLAAFESLMTKVSSLNKETLPSNYQVLANEQGEKQNVPTPGLIELGKVTQTYKDLIDTVSLTQLQTYQNIKVKHKGQSLDIEKYKSLVAPDFSAFPKYEVGEIDSMLSEQEQLRDQAANVGETEKQEYGDLIRNDYNSFARRFGSDYRYVFRTTDKSSGEKSWLDGALEGLFGSGDSHKKVGKGNTVAVPGVAIDSDIAARNNDFKRIVDLFYARSYLRLKRGMQICAIQPKAVPATNFDAWLKLDPMRQLNTQLACTREELADALENARRIIISTGVQSEEVFGEEGFLESGILNKLGTAVTFTLGKRPIAEALHMLMQLVYADIQEEYMLANRGQGLRSLYDMYGDRYQSSQEQKDYYTIVKCNYDSSASGCNEISSDDAFATIGNEGIAGDYGQVWKTLSNRMAFARDLLDQADRIQVELDSFRSSSKEHERAKSRDSKL